MNYRWVQDVANDPAEIDTWQGEDTATASFTVPETLAPARYTITLAIQGRGATNVFQGTDTLTVEVVGAPRVQSVAIVSAPPAPPSYRAGEAIEVEVTFTEDVVVTGTPTFPLEIGSVTRDAPFVRESSPGAVVFAWTVLADDLDTDGISSGAGEIAIPAGASIVSAEGPRAASPAYTAFAGQTDHLVDGRVAAPDSGVCGRSPAIRDALVAGTGAATCGAVRDADLAALTTLSAASGGLTGIRAGDFAGLDALASLDLSGNAIAALNAGDFDGLSTVTTLDLASNSLRDPAVERVPGARRAGDARPCQQRAWRNPRDGRLRRALEPDLPRSRQQFAGGRRSAGRGVRSADGAHGARSFVQRISLGTSGGTARPEHRAGAGEPALRAHQHASRRVLREPHRARAGRPEERNPYW